MSFMGAHVSAQIWAQACVYTHYMISWHPDFIASEDYVGFTDCERCMNVFLDISASQNVNCYRM